MIQLIICGSSEQPFGKASIHFSAIKVSLLIITAWKYVEDMHLCASLFSWAVHLHVVFLLVLPRASSYFGYLYSLFFHKSLSHCQCRRSQQLPLIPLFSTKVQCGKSGPAAQQLSRLCLCSDDRDLLINALKPHR